MVGFLGFHEVRSCQDRARLSIWGPLPPPDIWIMVYRPHDIGVMAPVSY